MGVEGYNPPNVDCPDCDLPSKTFFIGGRYDSTLELTIYTWRCEHHHEWFALEDPRENARSGKTNE